MLPITAARDSATAAASDIAGVERTPPRSVYSGAQFGTRRQYGHPLIDLYARVLGSDAASFTLTCYDHAAATTLTLANPNPKSPDPKPRKRTIQPWAPHMRDATSNTSSIHRFNALDRRGPPPLVYVTLPVYLRRTPAHLVHALRDAQMHLRARREAVN
ncbi:hypothetical protein C8J57DRAFT_1726948 [Mycena rebaudengoi]|nr:hypothetical protein C8J57DRAFT_1726948 [Mycena rebaudengoi]